MADMDYKAAYLRQKKAREIAETILEDKSRELYEANQSLMMAYNRLKDQKSQLIHQEKLASIGQLSAGVAHEINNPTGFVKSNLNSLKAYINSAIEAFSDYETAIARQPQSSEQTQQEINNIRKKHDIDFMVEDIFELLEESLEGASRIEDIVASLKNFARPDEDGDCIFSLNDCITNTLKLVNNEVKYKANIHLDLQEHPNMYGKPGAMSQVILNLVVNAADAIAEHGNIYISTRKKDNKIELKVKDDGQGIPQEIITKIFDPFFTTKEVGKGTGLGLSISHGIIKKHNGIMVVDSEPNKGTTFNITFTL